MTSTNINILDYWNDRKDTLNPTDVLERYMKDKKRSNTNQKAIDSQTASKYKNKTIQNNYVGPKSGEKVSTNSINIDAQYDDNDESYVDKDFESNINDAAFQNLDSSNISSDSQHIGDNSGNLTTQPYPPTNQKPKKSTQFRHTLSAKKKTSTVDNLSANSQTATITTVVSNTSSLTTFSDQRHKPVPTVPPTSSLIAASTTRQHTTTSPTSHSKNVVNNTSLTIDFDAGYYNHDNNRINYKIPCNNNSISSSGSNDSPYLKKKKSLTTNHVKTSLSDFTASSTTTNSNTSTIITNTYTSIPNMNNIINKVSAVNERRMSEHAQFIQDADVITVPVFPAQEFETIKNSNDNGNDPPQIGNLTNSTGADRANTANNNDDDDDDDEFMYNELKSSKSKSNTSNDDIKVIEIIPSSSLSSAHVSNKDNNNNNNNYSFPTITGTKQPSSIAIQPTGPSSNNNNNSNNNKFPKNKTSYASNHSIIANNTTTNSNNNSSNIHNNNSNNAKSSPRQGLPKININNNNSNSSNNRNITQTILKLKPSSSIVPKTISTPNGDGGKKNDKRINPVARINNSNNATNNNNKVTNHISSTHNNNNNNNNNNSKNTNDNVLNSDASGTGIVSKPSQHSTSPSHTSSSSLSSSSSPSSSLNTCHQQSSHSHPVSTERPLLAMFAHKIKDTSTTSAIKRKNSHNSSKNTSNTDNNKNNSVNTIDNNNNSSSSSSSNIVDEEDYYEYDNHFDDDEQGDDNNNNDNNDDVNNNDDVDSLELSSSLPAHIYEHFLPTSDTATSSTGTGASANKEAMLAAAVVDALNKDDDDNDDGEVRLKLNNLKVNDANTNTNTVSNNAYGIASVAAATSGHSIISSTDSSSRGGMVIDTELATLTTTANDTAGATGLPPRPSSSSVQHNSSNNNSHTHTTTHGNVSVDKLRSSTKKTVLIKDDDPFDAVAIEDPHIRFNMNNNANRNMNTDEMITEENDSGRKSMGSRSGSASGGGGSWISNMAMNARRKSQVLASAFADALRTKKQGLRKTDAISSLEYLLPNSPTDMMNAMSSPSRSSLLYFGGGNSTNNNTNPIIMNFSQSAASTAAAALAAAAQTQEVKELYLQRKMKWDAFCMKMKCLGLQIASDRVEKGIQLGRGKFAAVYIGVLKSDRHLLITPRPEDISNNNNNCSVSRPTSSATNTRNNTNSNSSNNTNSNNNNNNNGLYNINNNTSISNFTVLANLKKYALSSATLLSPSSSASSPRVTSSSGGSGNNNRNSFHGGIERGKSRNSFNNTNDHPHNSSSSSSSSSSVIKTSIAMKIASFSGNDFVFEGTSFPTSRNSSRPTASTLTAGTAASTVVNQIINSSNNTDERAYEESKDSNSNSNNIGNNENNKENDQINDDNKNNDDNNNNTTDEDSMIFEIDDSRSSHNNSSKTTDDDGDNFSFRSNRSIHSDLVLTREIVPPPQVIDEYEREIDALHGLSGHKNIIQLYGIILRPLSIIMQKMDMSLGDYIVSDAWKSLSYKQKVNIMAGVSSGVAHMHNKLYIHRDLKPHNILIRIERRSTRPQQQISSSLFNMASFSPKSAVSAMIATATATVVAKGIAESNNTLENTLNDNNNAVSVSTVSDVVKNSMDEKSMLDTQSSVVADVLLADQHSTYLSLPVTSSSSSSSSPSKSTRLNITTNIVRESITEPEVTILVKIADLGTAVKLSSAESMELVETCGTSGYTAPEVLRAESHYGLSADVFSLGMLTWELFSPNPLGNPLKGLDQTKAVQKMEEGIRPVFDPTAHPPLIQKIIEMAWRTEPETRPKMTDLEILVSRLQVIETTESTPID